MHLGHQPSKEDALESQQTPAAPSVTHAVAGEQLGAAQWLWPRTLCPVSQCHLAAPTVPPCLSGANSLPGPQWGIWKTRLILFVGFDGWKEQVCLQPEDLRFSQCNLRWSPSHAQDRQRGLARLRRRKASSAPHPVILQRPGARAGAGAGGAPGAGAACCPCGVTGDLEKGLGRGGRP